MASSSCTSKAPIVMLSRSREVFSEISEFRGQPSGLTTSHCILQPEPDRMFFSRDRSKRGVFDAAVELHWSAFLGYFLLRLAPRALNTQRAEGPRDPRRLAGELQACHPGPL